MADSLQPAVDSPEVQGKLSILEKNRAAWRRELERTAVGRVAVGTAWCSNVTEERNR